MILKRAFCDLDVSVGYPVLSLAHGEVGRGAHPGLVDAVQRAAEYLNEVVVL